MFLNHKRGKPHGGEFAFVLRRLGGDVTSRRRQCALLTMLSSIFGAEQRISRI